MPLSVRVFSLNALCHSALGLGQTQKTLSLSTVAILLLRSRTSRPGIRIDAMELDESWSEPGSEIIYRRCEKYL